MSFKTPDARTRESQAKAVQLSVTTVEKHFGELCQLSAGYARKTARLRDKSDLLVRELMAYSETERPSLKMGLRAFAEELSKVQDYRQAQVERLEAKVVEPLKSYGATIKIKREDLKAVLTSQTREAKQMQQLEKMRQRNPSDRHNISQAETELQRATVDAARSSRQLEETINEFERQKIKDIKKILCDFVTVEMVFHAKALEVYSQAYHHMHAVNEESDLEAFLNTLRPSDYQARLDTVLQNSLSTLNGTGSPQPMARSQQTGATGTQRNNQLQDVTSEDLDNRQSGS
uniref:CBY1 interacting BAR domain containing 1 n=1 Tax=Petromyzon marinus TaxID=7757 RepID=S4RZ02_PETMA